MRARRFALGAPLVVLASLSGVAGPSASAAGEQALVVQSAGAATAIEVATFKLPMVGTEPLEAWVGRSSGSLDDRTSQNEAFASVLYPTDVGAAPQGLFNLLGFPVVGDLLPADHPVVQAYGALPGLIPPWPLAARGSHPGDPGGRRNVLRSLTALIPGAVPVTLEGLVQQADAGGAFASSSALATDVTFSPPAELAGNEIAGAVEQAARFLGPVADTPSLGGFLARVAGIRTQYRAAKDGLTASSDAICDISRVEILDGLVELSGLQAVARFSVGPAGPATVEHTYHVAGARVLGVAVELTNDGVRVVDQRVPASQVAGAQEVLDGVLAAAPVRVTLPTQHADGGGVDTTLLSLAVPGSDLRLSFGLVQSRFAAQRVAGDSSEAVPVLASAGPPPEPPALGTATAPVPAPGLDVGGPAPGGEQDLQAGEAGPGGTAAPLAGASPEAPLGGRADEQLVAVSARLTTLMDRIAVLVALGALVSAVSWRRRRGVLLSLRR